MWDHRFSVFTALVKASAFHYLLLFQVLSFTVGMFSCEDCFDCFFSILDSWYISWLREMSLWPSLLWWILSLNGSSTLSFAVFFFFFHLTELSLWIKATHSLWTEDECQGHDLSHQNQKLQCRYLCLIKPPTLLIIICTKTCHS